MSLNIKERIKTTASVIIDVLQDIVLRTIDNRYVVFDNALNIYGVDEEDRCIYIQPNKTAPLYCVEIALKDNVPRTLSGFVSLAERLGRSEDAKVVLFYSKNPVMIDGHNDTFCTKQSIYLFSYSKSIVSRIAKAMRANMKTPTGIILALFDIGLINTYYNDPDTKKLRSYINASNFKSDEMHYLFKTIFAEGVYKAVADKEHLFNGRQYRAYQGYGYKNSFMSEAEVIRSLDENRPTYRADIPNIIKAFNEEWTGYVAFVFDFSSRRVESIAKAWRETTRFYELNRSVKKDIETFTDSIIKGTPGKYGILNVFAVIDNKEAVDDIFDSLNMDFVEKNVGTKDIVYHTPIERRDVSFDFPSTTIDFTRYIKAIHKRRSIRHKKSIDMYGKDVSGNYITYSFSESKSPHWSIVASTRSGKSFFVFSFLSQVLNAKIIDNPDYMRLEAIREHDDNLKEKLETNKKSEEFLHETPKAIIESCNNLGSVRVVHFDAGFSGRKWIEALKNCVPDKVSKFEQDVNYLRFGLTDIRWDEKNNIPDQEDMLFMGTVINLLLELNNDEALTKGEFSQIEEAYSSLYLQRDYDGYSLQKLKEIGGYDDVLLLIKSIYGNVPKTTRTTDLPGIHDDRRIAFLARPLPKDIIDYLNKKKDNHMVASSELELKDVMSALKKFSSVTDNPMFRYYSKTEITDSHYFYMELESIQALGDNYFIPVFLLMFQRLYRRDINRANRYKMAGEEVPKVIYIIEEYHNLRPERVSKLFEKVQREAGRYNIHLGFITQSGNDISEELLINIGTRIVMSSDKPDEQIDELKRYWAEDGEGDVGKGKLIEFFEQYNREYLAFMKYGGGVVTLTPPTTKAKEWMFDSNPTIKQKKEREDKEE